MNGKQDKNMDLHRLQTYTSAAKASSPAVLQQAWKACSTLCPCNHAWERRVLTHTLESPTRARFLRGGRESRASGGEGFN